MSKYRRTEYPQWSWSFSRQQMFEACRRRYYYNYYASHNGWEFGAAEEAAAAYRLKKLTNIYMVLGEAVHQSAERLIEKAAAGEELPNAAEVEASLRRELRRVWLASRNQRQLFLQRPGRQPMLHEFYYGGGPTEEAVARINERLPLVSEALVSSPLWRELKTPASRVISVEKFDTFDLAGTPVYAVPDLIYQDGAGLWVIADWKSGEQVEDNRAQVALYALYAHKKHGVPVEQILARLEYLSLGESVEMTFSQTDLEEVKKEALAGMAQMQSLLGDRELNAALPRENFPLTTARWQCAGCNFYELCEEELQETPLEPEVS